MVTVREFRQEGRDLGFREAFPDTRPEWSWTLVFSVKKLVGVAQ